jgi:hypothetical protein
MQGHTRQSTKSAYLSTDFPLIHLKTRNLLNLRKREIGKPDKLRDRVCGGAAYLQFPKSVVFLIHMNFQRCSSEPKLSSSKRGGTKLLVNSKAICYVRSQLKNKQKSQIVSCYFHQTFRKGKLKGTWTSNALGLGATTSHEWLTY